MRFAKSHRRLVNRGGNNTKGPTPATSDLRYHIGGDPIGSEKGFIHRKRVIAIGGGFYALEGVLNASEGVLDASEGVK